MQLDEKEMTIAGFIITWLLGIFGAGRAYGKLAERVDMHDAEIKEIKSYFVSPDGEPRLITYPAHDIMVSQCHAQIDLKIAHITESNDELKEDFGKLSDTVRQEMKSMAAALQKIAIHQAGHTHHRKTDDQEGDGFWG